MCGFMLRLVLNALLLFFVLTSFPGIFVDTLGGILLAVAIVGIANALVRPLLARTALPCGGLALGGITLATNVVAPLLVVKALPGFQIAGAVAPVAGVCLLTLCSCAVTKAIKDR